MEEKKVKILGISGSPRRSGSTAGMVQYCLEAAEKMGYVETEYLSLADYKLEPCTGCMKCFGYLAPADDEYQCYDTNDDIKILAPKLKECDGLLVGTNIYALGVPSLLRIFLEKLHHFGPMSFTKHGGGLRFKAVGIISQGGQLYGGQESAFFHLTNLFSTLGMYVAAAWPTVDDPMPSSTFFGGILTTIDGASIYGKNAWRKEATRTIPPVTGSRNERSLKNLGKHLAVSAMMMKLGKEAFQKENLPQPEIQSFTKYSVKPKTGSYVDRLMKEGKVTYVSPEELQKKAISKP